MGTILGIFLVIIILWIIISTIMLNEKVETSIENMMNDGIELDETIKESDIEDVPEIVWKYYNFAGVFGKKKISKVKVTMKGKVRHAEHEAWRTFTSEQYYTVDPIAYVWSKRSYMGRFPLTLMYERLGESMGYMIYKVLGSIKRFEHSGRAVNEAAVLKYLSDVLWFPTAFTSKNIRWEAVDEQSARAIITKGTITRSALFYFTEQGVPVNFVSNRYKYRGKEKGTYEWSVPVKGWKEFHGFKVPQFGRVLWHLPEGDFCYMQFEIVDVKFDS